jgi:hypothetical protein
MSKREFNTGDVIYWFDNNSVIPLASYAIIYRIQGMKISAFFIGGFTPTYLQKDRLVWFHVKQHNKLFFVYEAIQNEVSI